MAIPIHDTVIPKDASEELLLDKHVDFLLQYTQNKDDYEFVMAEFLRLNGVYWSITALDLMNNKDKISKTEIIEILRECESTSGGYSPAKDHDPSLLTTLSAVQIAVTFDVFNDVIDSERIVHYVKSLQKDDGSFMGDIWGEVDTRFSFCAIAILWLLNRVSDINLESATNFVLRSQNFDGGFGSKPGSESHAGNIYCCLGFLSLTHNLKHVDSDVLGVWLAERQLLSGGLNGRPQKLPDVCYSWWVLASLSILGRLKWINSKALSKFIYGSQDVDSGGISDRPGNLSDPFHTCFGIAGLSLLREHKELSIVNPVLCMSQSLLDACHYPRPQMLSL